MFCSLRYQHARPTRRAVLLSVTCPTLTYISTLSHKRHSFQEKNVIEHKIYVLVLSKILSEKRFLLRRTQGDIIINIHRSSNKVPVFLGRSESHLNILDRFSRSVHVPNFIKIRPVGYELFHADGRKGKQDEANSLFRHFCEGN